MTGDVTELGWVVYGWNPRRPGGCWLLLDMSVVDDPMSTTLLTHEGATRRALDANRFHHMGLRWKPSKITTTRSTP